MKCAKIVICNPYPASNLYTGKHGDHDNVRFKILSLCFVLGPILGSPVAPVWGADGLDLHHPPLFKKVYPALDIGFKGISWGSSYSRKSCTGPCLSRTVAVTEVVPDRALSYQRDFSLSLGQTGPVSFRFSGRRLKMEVAF